MYWWCCRPTAQWAILTQSSALINYDRKDTPRPCTVDFYSRLIPKNLILLAIIMRILLQTGRTVHLTVYDYVQLCIIKTCEQHVGLGISRLVSSSAHQPVRQSEAVRHCRQLSLILNLLSIVINRINLARSCRDHVMNCISTSCTITAGGRHRGRGDACQSLHTLINMYDCSRG